MESVKLLTRTTMKTVHAEEKIYEWITIWCKLVYGYRKDEEHAEKNKRACFWNKQTNQKGSHW